MGKIIFVLSLVLFVNFSAKGQETLTYYCPPCNCQAHETNEYFKESGTCPYCGMSLIQAQNTADPSISYEHLLEYEGKYEYVSESTLKIMASSMDTTLYAVINKAKYPLYHVKDDSFTNIDDTPVIFQRNNQGNINGYTVNGQVFELITTDIEKLVMYPRKELFNHPEDYIYQMPQKANDGLEVGNIKNAFEKPELIKEMVKETIKGEYPDVHSILVYKNDKLVLEEYFYGYDINTQHQLRSVTKAFIGSLVGLAIEAGAIGSEQDQLLPYFKDEYKSFDYMNKRKRSITIQDFLTYRHGLDCENNNPESEGNEQQMMESADWVKYTLDLPVVHQPGKVSSYCTGAALTLGRLVELATDKPLEEFADEHLFEPMNITNYDWRFDPDSTSRQTFSQMYLQPRDLVKLATMYLNGGKWQGKQILPENWVRKTFEEYTSEFGYLWEHKYFVIDGKQYNYYMASGNGGQKINIWPDYNMITVFTGGNYNSYELYGKSTPPNQMIPKYILPALD
jgi:CubicO group peptidase (beta-lactamase class C family)